MLGDLTITYLVASRELLSVIQLSQMSGSNYHSASEEVRTVEDNIKAVDVIYAQMC